MANPRRLPLQGDIGYEEQIAKLGTGAFGTKQNVIDVYNAQAKKYNQQMADRENIASFGKKDYVSATPEEVKGIKAESLDKYIQQGQLPPVVVQYVRDEILNRGIRNGKTEVKLPNVDEPLHVQVTNGSVGNIAVYERVNGQPYHILFSSRSGKLTEQGFVQPDEGGFTQDLLPLVLAGAGATYLAGSGLLGGGGAAAGSGALSPYAAQAAGAYGAGGASAITTGAGLLSTGSPFSVTTGAAGVNATNLATSSTGTAIANQIATQGVTPSLLQSAASFLNVKPETLASFAPSVIQGLLGVGASYLQSEQAKDAAETQANAQIRAAQIASDSARFRPVGVTTRFGSSNFQTDAAGNVIGAGYTASPEILNYQNRLSRLAGQGMTDIEGARTAYAPLTGAAQNLFSLGGSYLKKTPEEVAADYISKQQALLAPSQENQLALLQNKLQQQGRGGLSVAQGGNLMATSPELAAYYNSLAQSNLALAANADQEAQNRIKFGAGLFDTGANLQGRYYTGQTAAYAPFTTAMDVTSGLENLAQTPLTLGTQIGAKTTASAAEAGRLTGQGIINAAQTMAPSNAYSLGGNVLAGIAGSPNVTGALNRAFGVSTQPTQQLYTFNPATGQYQPVQSAFAT